VAAQQDRRSPLAVVLLTLLAEEPMHPYRMQQLMKERGKDRVANVAQRNSVYQTIERLQRIGLIRARETSRDERRPERTTYELTPEGERVVRDWLRTMLAEPATEFPQFPAALASLLILEPDEVRAQLEHRVERLTVEVAGTKAAIARIPRIFVLEEEYLLAVWRAELRWLRGIIESLRDGELSWTEAGLRTYLQTGQLP